MMPKQISSLPFSWSEMARKMCPQRWAGIEWLVVLVERKVCEREGEGGEG